ncbi:uncharacterized protein B0H18DRAFT_1176982 [Fomitopsis serialis]|uniref:uncharacterized protein n=1 Tax=Fomitopsis serialis TaxID=139415 RepID=UPI0020078AD7|nr:uncharacterized protein B0H18DRAFT_1176982 [Neoantrodia serialis]KAH9910636.1 hypothetical protein B0H18DRAFT_1176982 [Neoantrodia serialis]
MLHDYPSEDLYPPSTPESHEERIRRLARGVGLRWDSEDGSDEDTDSAEMNGVECESSGALGSPLPALDISQAYEHDDFEHTAHNDPPSRRGYYNTTCETCGLSVQVTDNTDYFMQQHLRSKRHKKEMSKQQAAQEKELADSVRNEHFPHPIIASDLERPEPSPPPASMPYETRCQPSRAPESNPAAVVSVRDHDYDTDTDHPDGATMSKACEGTVVQWSAGPVMKTFPWQVMEIRREQLGFHVSGLKNNGTELWMQSDDCEEEVLVDEEACSPCLRVPVSRAFRLLAERANQPWTPHTPYAWLNSVQSEAALNVKSTEISELRSREQAGIKKLNRTVQKLNDWKRLVKAIATHDVKNVHHLVRIALKQNCGPREIVERFFKALDHVYHARGQSEDDIDLAKLIEHYAGRNGLFAAQKHLGLPSSSSLHRLAKTPPVQPSSGKLRPAELTRNIHARFPPGAPHSRAKCGYSLSADGIAIERRMRWVKSIDCMVGACREHCSGLDMSMSNFSCVLEVAEAMHGDSPTCHYGSDATVFGMAPFRGDNYHIVPIAVSASCKAEKAEEFGDMIDMSIDEWDTHAAEDWGNMWTFSCDGASTFRGACYNRLMVREFDRSGALYRKLSHLKGLNLSCGKSDVVHAPDPKHLIKRAATHVRSMDGSVLNSVIINRMVVTRFLRMLPHQTHTSVDILVDPADHQNVPRAIKLLRAVIELSESELPGLKPTDTITYHAICLQAALWQSLLDAFMDPLLSLSDQLTHLSKFAHMSFALYLQHGSAFLSNQLYSDIQALIKAVYVCVARQQLLDDAQPFYLYQVGSDRLEELFAEVHTQSHDRNCDMAQLAERLAISAEIVDIYNRHPEWNRGQRRRSFTGREGVDHVNPRFYTGDMTVRNVNLGTVWHSGLIAADKALRSRGVHVNITDKLSCPKTDFMRPRGDTYPGVSTDPDRSVDASSEARPAVDTNHAQGMEPAEHESESVDPDLVNMELRDLLSSPDANGNVQTSQETDSDWLCVPGEDGNNPKELHKSSIVSGLFNPAGGRLSVDRLRRVRGFPRVFRAYSMRNEELTGEDVVNVGDTVLAPFRSLDSVAAGFMQVKGIERKGSRIAQVSEADLEDVSSAVVLTGQLLSMIPQSESDDLGPVETTPAQGIAVRDGGSLAEPQSHSRSPIGSSMAVSCGWLWTGDSVRFHSANTGAATRTAQKTDEGTRNSLSVHVPGSLSQPVDMAVVPIASLPPLQRQAFSDRGALHTCSVDQKTLHELTANLFKSVDPASLVSRLTRYGPADAKRFPYLDNNGNAPFLVDSAMRLIAEKNEGGVTGNRIQCYQCGRVIPPEMCRTHVGEHILRAILEVPEANLREQIHSVYPCGFCGRTGCNIDLLKTSSSYQPASNCPHAHKFNLAPAKKYSARMPSTNVPLHCDLCETDPTTKKKPTFWKYNIFNHIQDKHPRNWEAGTRRTKGLSKAFIASIDIDPRELTAIAPSATRIYPIPDAEADAQSQQDGMSTASKRPGDATVERRASKRIKL